MQERNGQPQNEHTPTPGGLYIAAARQDHLAHCAACRQRAEETETRYTQYGESIQRRDRIQLGLQLRPAVTA